ncbi:MAG: aspartate/glutamate racemase family protein, partial [Oscillospiraceae bacterium]|nr:aspartate/glutamate racemase family protein [Oscillospiraceae bacterium]
LHNIMDDFLADDPADTGEFSTVNKARLYNDIKSAEMTGADLIVVTCSTLSPTVAEIRPFVKTRIVTIDEAMAAQAVKTGKKIGLLATANSTVNASRFKLEEAAAKIGKTVEIEISHDEEAIRALKAGDAEKHNELVMKMAQKLHSPDVMVLAQASMAPMETALHERFGVPVYSSPALCIAQVKEILAKE